MELPWYREPEYRRISRPQTFSRFLRNYWLEFGIRACRCCGRYLGEDEFTESAKIYYQQCRSCDREYRRSYVLSDAQRERYRAKKKRNVRNLTDGYIRELLVDGTFLSSSDIPQGMVELKREQIKLMREVKNGTKCKDDAGTD